MKRRTTRNKLGDKPGVFPARSTSRAGEAGNPYGSRQRKERTLSYAAAMRSGWVSVSNEARLRVQALEKPYRGSLYEGFFDPVVARDDVVKVTRIKPRRSR